ncbi:hypothetical protein BsWGS_01697 [Bradybaena similaris]
MDDKRVADYFVIAGLDRNHQEPLEEFSNEAVTKPTFRQDPITDITVINRSLGEKVPKGYECLESTPAGYPANLNHGSLRCPDMFICYRRGRDKPPLKDLGILYEGKERVMPGCEVVHTTMQGHSANVNNSNSSRTFITYRRAEKSASSDTLVVVDICIIIGSRGEEPPLTFLKILKNLNKGMLGSDVFLCYKKAMVKTDILAYKASILGRYPAEDYEEFPLPSSVPMFCLPMGATLECWSAEAQHPVPSFSTFILTGAGGEKVYGAAISFYEEYKEEDLTDTQMRALGLKNKHIREQYRILKTVHVCKSIALLSHWPFFDAFKKFLSHLYKISITGSHTVPIERHISHFMYDVPYPCPERPRILVQLTNDSLSLCMPEDSPLPQSGASFVTVLRNLGPELTMNLLLFVLIESKILLHSLRPTVLTEVAEAVSTMIFPFHWQCPYIPLCPLGLSDVLSAPFPFIVGVDSRYFDLYDPPPEVICVDLDTNRIHTPEDKKSLNFKLLPKKPARVMYESLTKLYEKSSQSNALKNDDADEFSAAMAHFDQDFKRKKQITQLELAIQEVFLRFTASMLKDYKSYLNPIMKAPNKRTTDASSLFDMQGFLKSRDKANTKFFQQLMRTQMFFRFIEVRSFVSDKDAGLTFFDECTEKVDEMKDEPRLLEIDNSQASERTVFIMPPEPVGLPEGVKYSYNGFPELKSELFLSKKKSFVALPSKQQCPTSPLARRTKQEIKSAQKVAMQQVGNPKAWAKCLLSYCYSLWFVVFPAFVQTHPKKTEALKIGLAVLYKMQGAKLMTIDELCYRVLMLLAGQYDKPGMAVQVFSQMKKNGIHPNAITYGYYNRVMLEAKWPSPKSKGHLRWIKIRNVIIGIAHFRRSIRRRSMSIYSNSGSEFDQISHASVDSYLTETQVATKVEAVDVSPTLLLKDSTTAVEDGLSKNSSSLEERMSTGGVSDRGYNSMTKEDVKRLSQSAVSADENGSACSSAASENSDRPSKSKPDSWNPMNFSFLCSSSNTKPSAKFKKEVHIVDDNINNHIRRTRGGSIVKRSFSTPAGNKDDFEMLRSSLLTNACGLVILSEASLKRNSFIPDADLQQQVEEAKRRRHRSAGENQTKPARSMSLFASWRSPKPANGTDASIDVDDRSKITFRYSDLIKNEDKDHLNLGDSKVVKDLEGVSGNSSSSHLYATNSVVQFVIENEPDLNQVVSSKSTDAVKSDILHSVATVSSESCPSSHVLADAASDNQPGIVLEPVSQSAVSDPSSVVAETDNPSHETLLQDSAEQTASASIDSNAHCCNNSSSDTIENSATKQKKDIIFHDKIGDNSVLLDRSDIRRSVSISEDKLSDQHFSEIQIKPSLGGSSRTLNSSGGDIPVELRNPSKQIAEDVQSISSLTDTKKERPADFMLKRTQSLKRTNEAIGSYLKWASRAAFTKLNELKETITTPLRNGSLGSLGSLSSLTHSVEELDVNDGSSTSGTIRERLRQGGSQDLLSHSEDSETDETKKRLSGLSFESVPSPSYLDEYSCLREVPSNGVGPLTDKTVEELIKVALEVEISSCSRCTGCNHLIYDEEIMAGWSAEDSNLNTSCPYCQAKFVPHLQIYIKDWRGEANPVVFSTEHGCTMTEKLLARDGHQSALHRDAELTAEANERTQSPLEKGDLPLSLEEASKMSLRRCTSECLTMATDDLLPRAYMDSRGHNFRHSPLTLSIEEEKDSPNLPLLADSYSVKKEFMTRAPSSSEPIVVPYLSPLVLRKEVEYVLDHEGNSCLASDTVVEEHPIIYWNLVWFFRRIEVPTHLTAFLLTSKAFSCNKPQNVAKYKDLYTNRNILIRPQWDNVRIHDEIGLPMYSAWRAGHKSTVVDALVIDSDYFSRPLMWQIISSIKRNDVLNGMRQIAIARRRMMLRKRRFRSMYREVLFLAFAACGRENIDHDAFDREFTIAFEEKLQKNEKIQLQLDDYPKSTSIQWCRRVFSELEI